MPLTLENHLTEFPPELPETPAAYSQEYLERLFPLGVIREIDRYHRSTSAAELVKHPVPPDIAKEYRAVLPALTYNIGRHPAEILTVAREDAVEKSIKQQPETDGRPRAVCARRATVTYLLYTSMRQEGE